MTAPLRKLALDGKSAPAIPAQSLEPSSPAPFPRASGLPILATPADPFAFAAQFPDRWTAFLHAHYRDAIHVAYSLGVTEKGALKWWNGVGGPKGDKVALAAQQHPEGAVVYLFSGAGR